MLACVRSEAVRLVGATPTQKITTADPTPPSRPMALVSQGNIRCSTSESSLYLVGRRDDDDPNIFTSGLHRHHKLVSLCEAYAANSGTGKRALACLPSGRAVESAQLLDSCKSISHDPRKSISAKTCIISNEPFGNTGSVAREAPIAGPWWLALITSRKSLLHLGFASSCRVHLETLSVQRSHSDAYGLIVSTTAICRIRDGQRRST
ncbi:hypothetical protein MRB53_040228 [Persea americana]|nr:hypothetical protein MRB53_040228 [Persea americana]